MEENTRDFFEREAGLLRSLKIQFGKTALALYNNLNNSVFERVGLILPVDCGHNGELRPFQYKILQ